MMTEIQACIQALNNLDQCILNEVPKEERSPTKGNTGVHRYYAIQLHISHLRCLLRTTQERLQK